MIRIVAGPKRRVAAGCAVVGFPAVLHRITTCRNDAETGAGTGFSASRAASRPRASVRTIASCTAALGALLALGCGDPNTGVDPPVGNLFFPEGLQLDPRTPEDRAARYLFVSNGNNDLSFNGGSISVIDLEAFFDAWTADGPIGADGTPTDSYEIYPFCDGPGERCVLDVGAPTTDDFPCRRLGLLPQVVECDEAPFVVDGVRLGDFSTLISASQEPSGTPRLWVPVRGDPSITFIDVQNSWPDPPDLDCGQVQVDGEALDEARCASDHKLTHLRNDGSLDELEREPFNVHISEGDGFRYGFVAHSSGPQLTVIDLDGLQGGDDRPAIVDSQRIFLPTSNVVRTGGFGLATRPCGPCGDEDDGEAGFNVPSITQDCTRPLVYGTLRFQLLATSFTASGIDEAELPEGAAERTSCEDDAGNYVGPYCASPDEVGQACALVCEPQVRSQLRFPVGGIDPLNQSVGAALGDVRFGDACGNELYTLQTSPGALLRLDTSLDAGEPNDIPAGRPIEVCDQPSRFEIWPERSLAFVSCFQGAYLYVVDLAAEQVIDTVITGTGPHDVALDEVREMLYVTNLLEGSVSVIDVGLDRRTRFKEIARIGLQEPFSR